MNERDKSDMEIIALADDVAQKVKSRHDMARANIIAERFWLRLERIADAERRSKPQPRLT